MVESGETGDKEGKVRGVVVLHTEVVHHQDKSYRAGGVSEKTRGVGLIEVERLQERDETEIRQLTCLFETTSSSRFGRGCTAFRLCPVSKRVGGRGETRLGERRC